MVDKALENRLREAIVFAEYKQEPVTLTINDAKRLLYRLKTEDPKRNQLVYRKDA